jgi:dTDP-4-amino-4,6-dideoxygalactose transaminase
MQFIDLAAQQRRIKEKLDANIQKVLAHGQYIMGPEVKELETNLGRLPSPDSGLQLHCLGSRYG